MAIIVCPECGKKISDKSESCPNCGCPKSEFTRLESIENMPHELPEDERPEMFECIKCNRPLPVGIDKCIYCGYRYNAKSDTKIYAFATHVYECKCTCLNCGKDFSYTNVDIQNNKRGRWKDVASAATLISGSRLEQAIALNHKQESYNIDFNKCPSCGSRKLQKEYDDYFVDENGEYIEDYEPTLLDKVSECMKKIGIAIGDMLHTSFLLLMIIPIILILYWMFKMIKILFMF